MSTAEVIAHAKSPHLLAWLRQAQDEISQCRHASIVWHVRNEWRGVARGLQMASAITTDDRDLLEKYLDDFSVAHAKKIKRKQLPPRIDEE